MNGIVEAIKIDEWKRVFTNEISKRGRADAIKWHIAANLYYKGLTAKQSVIEYLKRV